MDTKIRFEKHGQGHVFQYWDELSQNDQESLLKQAAEIDLEEIDILVDTLVRGDGESESIDFAALEPAPYRPLVDAPAENSDWQEARRVGEEALRNGKVAAFTVAGGQGTRLGYDGPKGTFSVTPIKEKSLFQVFAEKILAARRLYGGVLPWYVMTSDLNHEQTVSFFEKNENFGLEEGTVKFFRQGRMPAVDYDGKIVLETKSSIAMSPDGHGGALRALDRSGALDEMEKAGVESLSYFQVDNPLVQCVDPYFIGFHLLGESEMSSKMVPKVDKDEKVGHFCKLGDRITVVEYSDMPDELGARTDERGELVYLAGSIAIHVVSVAFIRNLVSDDSGLKLPFHRADKKVPFLSPEGATVKPQSPNAIKFEMFVFDAVPFAANPLVLETTRLDDFSPVKNATGSDSPRTSKIDQQKLFAQWIRKCGVALSVDQSGVPDRAIEVSPLYAFNEQTFVDAWNVKKTRIGSEGDIYLAGD